MMQNEDARYAVEVMADMYVVRAAMQRITAAGVTVPDSVFDAFDNIEGTATETLLDAVIHSDVDLNVEATIAQEIEDLHTQVVEDRRREEEEFSMGFDAAHAESEMGL